MSVFCPKCGKENISNVGKFPNGGALFVAEEFDTSTEAFDVDITEFGCHDCGAIFYMDTDLPEDDEETEEETEEEDFSGEIVFVPPTRMNYVVGFAFDTKFKNVVVIEKTKPEDLAGKLNGVGGKVEPDEDEGFAMVREFIEETGVMIGSWEPIGKLELNSYFIEDQFTINFFYAINDDIKHCKTVEEEVVTVMPIEEALSSTNFDGQAHWFLRQALAEAKMRGRV